LDLEFVRHEIVKNGNTKVNYFINQQPVSEDTYYKIQEHDFEKYQNFIDEPLKENNAFNTYEEEVLEIVKKIRELENENEAVNVMLNILELIEENACRFATIEALHKQHDIIYDLIKELEDK
jgi:hypothetical protein